MAGCRAWSRIGNGSRHDRHNPGQASRPRRRTVRAEEYAPPASSGEKFARRRPEVRQSPCPYATNVRCGIRPAPPEPPTSSPCKMIWNRVPRASGATSWAAMSRWLSAAIILTLTAFVVTGYSPFAAAGEEAAETAAWATDLRAGWKASSRDMSDAVAPTRRRPGTVAGQRRRGSHRLVASMIAESDGSQVADPRDRNPGHVVGRNRGAICGAGASSAGVAPVRRVRFFGGASPHADVLPKRSRLAACSGISGSN